MKVKNQIKTVVVGVDLSKYSEIVVNQAKLLSKKLNAPLVYVYAFEDVLNYKWQYVMFDNQIKKYYDKMVRDRYSLTKKDIVVVRRGPASKQIISAARVFVRPLIVVGHFGQTALARFFIGSTAENLALKSPYPVWIHRGKKSFLPKNVLIPCDFSARAGNAIAGAKILKFANSKVELFHVLEPQPPQLDYQYWQLLQTAREKSNAIELKKLRTKYAPIKVTESNAIDVVSDIQRHLKDFDLLAISPRESKNRFGRYGSVTTKLVRTGDRPILVTP